MRYSGGRRACRERRLQGPGLVPLRPRSTPAARGWWLAEHLPELKPDNPAVREHRYGPHDAIVRTYLQDGVNGWPVAADLDFEFLATAQQPGRAQPGRRLQRLQAG